MKKYYYYFFYLTSILGRKINKRDDDYTFAGLLVVSTCISMHVFSILFLLDKFGILKVKEKLYLILIMAVVFQINSFLLMKKGKDKKIVRYFDNRFLKRAHNYWCIIGAGLYFIFSIAACTYCVYLVRTK